MRSRNIKPGFFCNEQLAECSPFARLLFIGLWCYCDCEGRGENRPKRLKMKIFPGDALRIEPLLEELANHGLIVLYGETTTEQPDPPFIWIPTFKAHQSPHIKEKKTGSKLPPCPLENGTGTKHIPVQSGASPVPAPDRYQASPADSCFPLPVCGCSDTPPPEEGPESAQKEESPPNPTPASKIAEAIMADWNVVAEQCELTPCRRMTDKRVQAVRARWKDHDWREHYLEALNRLKGIRWVRGANDRGWIANIDWFLRPDTVNKLLEDGYDDNDDGPAFQQTTGWDLP